MDKKYFSITCRGESYKIFKELKKDIPHRQTFSVATWDEALHFLINATLQAIQKNQLKKVHINLDQSSKQWAIRVNENIFIMAQNLKEQLADTLGLKRVSWDDCLAYMFGCGQNVLQNMKPTPKQPQEKKTTINVLPQTRERLDDLAKSLITPGRPNKLSTEEVVAFLLDFYDQNSL